VIKVELFFLAVLIVGMPLGSLATIAIQRYLAYRDSRIVKVRVQDALEDAPTPDLLDELSTRDDLSTNERKRNA